jgi:hypothetical protein
LKVLVRNTLPVDQPIRLWIKISFLVNTDGSPKGAKRFLNSMSLRAKRSNSLKIKRLLRLPAAGRLLHSSQ